MISPSSLSSPTRDLSILTTQSLIALPTVPNLLDAGVFMVNAGDVSVNP